MASVAAATHHHGADAGIGKDFQQQGVGNAAIEDVGRTHSLGQGPNAALGLGHHAPSDYSFIDQTPSLREAQLVELV